MGFLKRVMRFVDVSIEFGDCVTCRRKVRYGHRETAEKAAFAMHDKGSKPPEPYYCSCCKGWHIGGKLSS